MFKVIKNSTKYVRNLSGDEVGKLPIGTTFLGTVGTTSRRTLCVRIYSGIVDLEDLGQTWSPSAHSGHFPNINDFQEVDVEAIIKEIK